MSSIRILEWRQEATPEDILKLEDELAACSEIKEQHRIDIRDFLLQEKIYYLSDIEYAVRERYEQHVMNEFKQYSWRQRMTDFDKVKQHSIREQMQTVSGIHQNKLKYDNQVLYLPYHPELNIAGGFDTVIDKHTLVWDFSKDAPEKMKRQIFDALHYLFQVHPDRKKRNRPYRALRIFYDFCVQEKIEDIEAMEIEDIERYKQVFQSAKEIESYVPIVNFCKKMIFLQATDIHWNAGIWYMERIHIEEWRVNPSTPVISMTFLDVKSMKNRQVLQRYMQYEIGLTSIAIGTLNVEFINLKSFFIWYEQETDENICNASEIHLHRFFKYLDERAIQDETYNKIVRVVYHFFSFLRIRGYIQQIPFHEEFYLKKLVSKHHDRKVEDKVYLEVISKLYCFPETIRLMFLHLWCVGLRANEVCKLKAKDYYIDGEDAWLFVYQSKLKNYKRIPIPWALYKLMKVYIAKYKIEPEGYVFQNKCGGAYSYSTFRRKMIENCEANRIKNGEYLFRSHDYRHTVATNFYDNGVSLQGVRDYLGHVYDEMTQQYIDYMPQRIAKANEDYFSTKGKSLAGRFIVRCGDGKKNIPE